MTENPRGQKRRQLLGRLLCGAGIIIGVFYLYQGLDRLPPAPQERKPAEIVVTFEEDHTAEPSAEKLSFAEFCRRNPVSTCFDNRETADFLYQENEPTAIMPSEEFAPQLLEAALKAEDKTAQPQPEPLLAQEAVYQMYEEDLPEDVIEARPLSNPKLLGKTIIPAHKPPYFGEKPVIAVVIDDMGISAKRTADIASLKAPLTVSFLTYGRHLDKQVENSRAAGQEIMIHVPMEAQKNIDAAPDVLTTKMNLDEIKANLAAMLDKFHDVKGINNHMGSKLTEDKARMSAIMEVLKKRGLFFLDSKTSAASKAEDAAAEAGLAYAHRHVFIDNNNDKDYILGQLAKAENIARQNGYAIAIGHPKTQTFAALQEWLPALEEKGIVLTPLSRIVEALNPAVY